jgi:hypothetical protein
LKKDVRLYHIVLNAQDRPNPLTPTADFLVGILIPFKSSNLRHPRWNTYFIFAEEILFAEIYNPHDRVASAFEDINIDCRQLFFM